MKPETSAWSLVLLRRLPLVARIANGIPNHARRRSGPRPIRVRGLFAGGDQVSRDGQYRGLIARAKEDAVNKNKMRKLRLSREALRNLTGAGKMTPAGGTDALPTSPMNGCPIPSMHTDCETCAWCSYTCDSHTPESIIVIS